MQHFLSILQLSQKQIYALFDRAFYFKTEKQYPNYANHRLALLFYEKSTRTRVSFEVAAQNLSIPVVHLDLKASSEAKGEIMADTLQTLAALGVNIFVIRHSKEGVLLPLVQSAFAEKIHLLNAGDGKQEHPSQALLDFMTILSAKKNLSDLKITLVGDLRHSRVARSFMQLAKILELPPLTLVAPKIWQPLEPEWGTLTDSLAEGLVSADVVICLRIQKERMLEEENMDLSQYQDRYTVTTKRLSLAKPDVMVMHPGPINREIEIEGEVADGPHSFILEQVQNGVFMRMALLEALINGLE